MMSLEEILAITAPAAASVGPTPDAYKTLNKKLKMKRPAAAKKTAKKVASAASQEPDAEKVASTSQGHAAVIAPNDIIFPYVEWGGVEPAREVMINRVHSRAWHAEMKHRIAQQMPQEAAIKRATEVASQAVERWSALFPV